MDSPISDRWQRMIDRLIEESRERNEFDAREGKGKPLAPTEEEDLAGSMAMANKALKNGGYAPDFITLNHEIDADIQKLRGILRVAARRTVRLQAEAERLVGAAAAQHQEEAERAWRQAREQAETQVAEINSKILLFNLKNRIPNLHRYRVQLDALADEIMGEVRRE